MAIAVELGLIRLDCVGVDRYVLQVHRQQPHDTSVARAAALDPQLVRFGSVIGIFEAHELKPSS
jgi:hypothetical protein